jgi:cytochrome P450
MATATLPPGPSGPAVFQAISTLTAARWRMRRLHQRYGDAFSIRLPAVDHALVISDPAEVRQLFQTSPDIVDNVGRNLGRVLGPGSLFALNGEEHRRQRKLLVPPFHGRRLAAYERIVEDETARELATWPRGAPFPTMPSMMRITLSVILRAVFGAEGAEFGQLRELLPRMVALGSRLASLPIPEVDLGWWSPWGRFRAMRRRYDAIVERLIAGAARDPHLDERDDILAMMLQSRYDDGGAMSHSDIADQLLTLLSAGHETTATTLAWTVERLRRHPDVLDELVAEVDAGGGALRQATIIEVQRTRPVVELVGREVRAESFRLGRWTLPRGCAVIVSITLVHDNDALFPDARAFDPSRFLDAKPDLYEWIPFGGGTRRCLGAAFANMEMNVVLRTMLRDYTLLPTSEPAERRHSRGIANAPAKGGLAVVRPRATRLASATEKAATATTVAATAPTANAPTGTAATGTAATGTATTANATAGNATTANPTAENATTGGLS